jgi:hypothetical protein
MHTGGGAGGLTASPHPTTPMQIFKKLVNKNAIRAKIGDHLGNFPKKLEPQAKI